MTWPSARVPQWQEVRTGYQLHRQAQQCGTQLGCSGQALVHHKASGLHRRSLRRSHCAADSVSKLQNQQLVSGRISVPHSQLWALEQGDLAVFPHSETFSVLLWEWAKDKQPCSWPCEAEFSMSTACQQLEGLLKQKKAFKSIQKYPEPYSIVWQRQEKKFQREDLLLDKHRQGTGPEFLNNSETQSFLLRCCFLLCTILKQSFQKYKQKLLQLLP